MFMPCPSLDVWCTCLEVVAVQPIVSTSRTATHVREGPECEYARLCLEPRLGKSYEFFFLLPLVANLPERHRKQVGISRVR